MTQADADPDMTPFLTQRAYQELGHGEAVEAILRSQAVAMPPTVKAPHGPSWRGCRSDQPARFRSAAAVRAGS